MRIAIFDYRVTSTNPIGGCHLKMLRGLSDRHEFTVFAVEFENPAPDRIRWVRIPVPVRPYVLLYTMYHAFAPFAYWYQRLFRGARFDLVQIVESNLLLGQVSYSQFCHRLFLKRHYRDTKAPGVRGFLRGLAHWTAARLEPLVYGRIRHVIAPSRGLLRELEAEYPSRQRQIHLLPNPVDVDRLHPPSAAERQEARASLGIEPNQTVLVFAALGHFERKGLPLVMEAVRRLDDPAIRVMVVGGQRGLVSEYRRRVGGMGLEKVIRFEGMQRDLLRYYWAADAFLFPSYYEVFPLVALEAAAAGLPLLVTPLNGVEEMLADRENGFLLERTVDGVHDGIRRLLGLSEQERREMGNCARQSAMRYSVGNFVDAWDHFYAHLA